MKVAFSLVKPSSPGLYLYRPDSGPRLTAEPQLVRVADRGNGLESQLAGSPGSPWMRLEWQGGLWSEVLELSPALDPLVTGGAW